MRIRDNTFDLTPEIYKAISSTGYTGRTMKNENDISLTNKILRDLGYTGMGDRSSNRKKFSTIPLRKLVEEHQNKIFDEITDSSDDLQGEGVKIIVPSNISKIYTRLEVLLGL